MKWCNDLHENLNPGPMPFRRWWCCNQPPPRTKFGGSRAGRGATPTFPQRPPAQHAHMHAPTHTDTHIYAHVARNSYMPSPPWGTAPPGFGRLCLAAPQRFAPRAVEVLAVPRQSLLDEPRCLRPLRGGQRGREVGGVQRELLQEPVPGVAGGGLLQGLGAVGGGGGGASWAGWGGRGSSVRG